MVRWAAAKREVMEALAAEIAHNYGRGRTIVAVDGSTTSGFADDLGVALEQAGHLVFRASAGDFRRPADDHSNDQDLLGLDLSLFRRVLIEPFRLAGSTGFVLDAYDAERDVAVEPKWITAGPDAILVVDGQNLHRPELVGTWNYSLWLDDGAGTDQVARSTAAAVIDLRDPEQPRRLFADSC
ncbi:hypothetical protein BH09ACT3_BH09ACT3_10200 [soil metagenome]